jgi:cytochrome c oxidase assembly protein subunit 15
MTGWYRSHQVPFILAVIAFMIITTGGWIRISDAGESCPDWPTCFGTWGFDVSPEEQEEWWKENPDEIDSRGEGHRYTSDQIFTEWLHRLLVGIIGILVLYSHYTAWSLRDEIGKLTYSLHYIVTFLLVLQAVMGYITVDMDNAPWTVSLHLLLALAFTGSLIAVGLVWWQNQSGLPEYMQIENPSEELRRLTGGTALIVLVQLLVGAYLSSGYHRAACGIEFGDSWPLCDGKIIPNLSVLGLQIQFLHRILAVGVVGLLFWYSRWIKANHGKSVLSSFIDAALILFILNILLGGWYLISAGFTSEAVFTGSLSLLHLLLGVCTFLCLAWAYLLCALPSHNPKV